MHRYTLKILAITALLVLATIALCGSASAVVQLNSKFVSINNLPAKVHTTEKVILKITVKNTGNQAWLPNGRYRLDIRGIPIYSLLPG
jgi:hypothetical protein